ncbi:MAG: DUF4123 domain-containing protein, partial [Oxalobacteraceae bacterium]
MSQGCADHRRGNRLHWRRRSTARDHAGSGAARRRAVRARLTLQTTVVPNAHPALHVQQVDPAYLRETSAEGQLFAIVDGCAAPDLPSLARALGPERAVCLYLGTAAENYADKAPYLIRVDPTLLSEWRERFGADAWGCLFTSSERWDTVRRHLRSLLTVSSPEGEAWLFRFWDPRLLPAFLRASQPDELNAFFGPLAT